MENQRSRLLQVVVAVLLLNPALDARADTYDLSRVRASVPDFGADEDREYFDAGYDNWDFNDYSEPSDDGDEEMTDEQREACDAIAARAPSSCDLSSAPFLVTNGCGSEGSELVPDYLIINMAPVLHLGPIFTEACNDHDVCYGTYQADKDACDLALHNDMINYAKRDLLDRQWLLYGVPIATQALLFSQALQSPFLAGASGAAFNAAQLEGACRYYADKAQRAGCIK